jgi:hypothetical protein
MRSSPLLWPSISGIAILLLLVLDLPGKPVFAADNQVVRGGACGRRFAGGVELWDKIRVNEREAKMRSSPLLWPSISGIAILLLLVLDLPGKPVFAADNQVVRRWRVRTPICRWCRIVGQRGQKAQWPHHTPARCASRRFDLLAGSNR